MRLEQVAINSVSTKHKDLDEALAAYAAAGFRNVEFVIPQVKAWLAASGGRTPREFKTLLDRHDLRSIGGFETTVQGFGDAAARRANHDLHAANAQLIEALGGGTIVAGTDGNEKNDIETLKAIGRTCRELAGRFPPGVKLAIEFNWSPVVKSLRSAAIVVEEADDPRVGILFDPAHYHCTPSKFEDLTDEVVRRIVHVHVNDMRAVPGDRANCNADRVLPGEGVLDLPRLLGRIEAGGYEGFFSIEMFNEGLWSLPAAEAARRMHAAMSDLCGER